MIMKQMHETDHSCKVRLLGIKNSWKILVIITNFWYKMYHRNIEFEQEHTLQRHFGPRCWFVLELWCTLQFWWKSRVCRNQNYSIRPFCLAETKWYKKPRIISYIKSVQEYIFKQHGGVCIVSVAFVRVIVPHNIPRGDFRYSIVFTA